MFSKGLWSDSIRNSFPYTYVWNLSQPNTTASNSLSIFGYHDSAADTLLLAKAIILLSFINVVLRPSILVSTCIVVFAFGLKYDKQIFMMGIFHVCHSSRCLFSLETSVVLFWH